MPGLPVEGDTFGRYLVHGRIGRGGMGFVLRATQLDLDRTVALKLLSPQLMDVDDSVERFRREAMSLARLESQHVVQVYDAGEHDGWLYIATQYIPDGDANRLLSDQGALDPAVALGICDDVLTGLADAHAIGMLHRDVKPSNVLIRRHEGSMRSYLCDLGISETMGADYTRTVGLLGTLGYLAPERHRGEPASVQSDIYSVGCLLWALVTGEAPYRGTDLQVALDHQSAPIPVLLGTGPLVNKINWLLSESMSKWPGDRFESAQAMRKALHGRAPASFASPDSPQALPATDDEVTLRRLPLPQHPRSVPRPSSTSAVSLTGSSTEKPSTGTSADGGAMGEGPPAARGGSRWAPIISTAIVCLVVIVGGVVAALTVGGGSGSPVAGVGDSTGVLPPESTRSPPGPAGAQCWDGSRATRVSDCAPPNGRPGLAWVFPSVSDQRCVVDTTQRAMSRVIALECRDVLADGTSILIDYIQWASVADAYSQFDSSLSERADVPDRAGQVVLHRWLGEVGNEYQAAQVYAHHPYSVTVHVASVEKLAPVVAEGLVRLRPATEVRGIGPP